jgi:hypothetical protein
MSNPGVIVLDQTELSGREINGSRLQIEDNIGEAIHIHLGDLRLDFTINDFLILADGLKQALNNLLSSTNINLDLLDPLFIREIEDHIPYLQRYKIENRYLDDMYCLEYSAAKISGFKTCKIIDTTEFKMLAANYENINNRKYQKYEISALFTDSIEELKTSIETKGYPFNNKYIVLLGNDVVIRDGKKRAVWLRYLYGNIEVPVLNLIFKENYSKYETTNHININKYLKYHLKLIIPLRIKKFIKLIINRAR